MQAFVDKWLYEFMKANCDAVSMLHAGFEDYIACRACMHANCIFQAAILGAQAVEKLLKAGLRLSGDTTPFRHRHRGHRIVKMTGLLAQRHWMDTDRCMALAGELEYHFAKNRYPPDKTDADYLEPRRGIDVQLFRTLDEFVLGYFDALPVREELKAALGASAAFHNAEVLARRGLPDLMWEALARDNIALRHRLCGIRHMLASHGDFLARNVLPGLSRLTPPGA